jgi:hypothetical protein
MCGLPCHLDLSGESMPAGEAAVSQLKAAMGRGDAVMMMTQTTVILSSIFVFLHWLFNWNMVSNFEHCF